MSEAKANALVDSWNADAALGLTDEQATNVKFRLERMCRIDRIISLF